MFKFLLFFALLAAVTAFTAFPAATKAPRLCMVGNGLSAQRPSNKLSYSAPAVNYKDNSNKSGYVPDGLNEEQYKKFVAAEAAKKAQVKNKFFKGKEVETLTEWMQENESKGLKGVELNRKGHKMVKAKYDGWYTNDSPV
eukprot:gene30034-36272_t